MQAPHTRAVRQREQYFGCPSPNDLQQPYLLAQYRTSTSACTDDPRPIFAAFSTRASGPTASHLRYAWGLSSNSRQIGRFSVQNDVCERIFLLNPLLQIGKLGDIPDQKYSHTTIFIKDRSQTSFCTETDTDSLIFIPKAVGSLSFLKVFIMRTVYVRNHLLRRFCLCLRPSPSPPLWFTSVTPQTRSHKPLHAVDP